MPSEEPEIEEAERLWSPYRDSGSAQIAHVGLSVGSEQEARAVAWLDGSERERRQRFLHDSPRSRFTLCRAALRSMLCAELGCRNEHLSFETSEHGKPFARIRGLDAPVSFNVSHSGAHGLIAVSPRGRIGVDIEVRSSRPNLGLLAESVLTPEEQAELAAIRGDRKLRAFFRLWTFKEALSKAHGMGLSLDVTRFEVPPAMRRGERSGVFRFAGLSESEWRLDNLSSADFAAALAHEQV